MLGFFFSMEQHLKKCSYWKNKGHQGQDLGNAKIVIFHADQLQLKARMKAKKNSNFFEPFCFFLQMKSFQTNIKVIFYHC